MKIYGDYTFLLDKLNVWNNSQVRTSKNGTKIVEFAEKFLEEQRAASQDQVNISREGLEYLRELTSDLGPSDQSSRIDESSVRKINDDGLSLMDGLCRTYILQRLDGSGADNASNKLYNEMAGKYRENLASCEDQSIESHAESLAKAHLAVCDKIIEGYDNGTREVWILDNNMRDDFKGVEFEIDGNAVRYRKLSKEEELNKVEKTFEELVYNVSQELVEKARQAYREYREMSADWLAAGMGEEMDDATREAVEGFWDLDKATSSKVDELKELIKKIEEEEMKKKKAKELSFGDRLALEQAEYRETIVVRGKQQAQYANYRKMSQMMSDAQTLLGNIKA